MNERKNQRNLLALLNDYTHTQIHWILSHTKRDEIKTKKKMQHKFYLQNQQMPLIMINLK